VGSISARFPFATLFAQKPPYCGSNFAAACVLFAAAISLAAANGQNPLVTGKSITLPPLGTQQNVGSLPMQIIVSPNGRFAVTSDMGLRQSLWSIHTTNGQGVSNIEFFNSPGPNATANGLYYGLAFAPDGMLYAAQGNADSIVGFSLSDAGVLTQVRTIKTEKNDFPSGLAADNRGLLYVANNDPSTFPRQAASRFTTRQSVWRLGGSPSAQALTGHRTSRSQYQSFLMAVNFTSPASGMTPCMS
jgi:hypothetical protein